MNKQVLNPKTDGEEHLFPRIEEDSEELGVDPEHGEATGTRKIVIGDAAYTMHSTDPFGFWHIEPTKGKLPKDLDGTWTSAYECQKAIEAYVASKRKA